MSKELHLNEKYSYILSKFKVEGNLIDIKSYDQGHINTTLIATLNDHGKTHRYILQRINTDVFKDVEKLCENIHNVTVFLKKKIHDRHGDEDRETLFLIPTIDGHHYIFDEELGYFRLFPFIEDTICLDNSESTDDFLLVGKSFGGFLRDLADFPTETLYETIPNFHDTAKRFDTFMQVLNEDKLNRKKDVEEEIQFILDRKEETHILVDLLSEGKLPSRVTHNDTKLNNILIDKDTKKGICVIDLDTVMPGLAAYDYGDAIRSGANTGKEDEQDLTLVNFSLPLFEAFTKGYLSVLKDTLTDLEKETLVFGAKLITFECGMRFLTDYLSGDTYFKTQFPGHNVVRCRTQFKLVKDMEEHFQEMIDIVKKYS